MNRMWPAWLLVTLLVGCTSQTVTPPPRYGQPDEILQEKGWALLIYHTQKGTRSEGRHGVLLHDNQEVEGTPGQHLQTPLGTLTHHGTQDQAAHLWDTTGWALRETTLSEPRPRERVPLRRNVTR